MWDYLAGECGDLTAIVDPIHPPDMPGGKRAPKGAETRLTYSEMRTNIGTMAAALMGLGVQKEVIVLQDSLACDSLTTAVINFRLVCEGQLVCFSFNRLRY